VAYFEENSGDVLAKLEECQLSLVKSGDHDTAQLVSVAILGLRIKINRIADSELKALCDAIVQEEEAASRPLSPNPQEAPRPRPPVSLKLVK
jgi:hypothetical protein